MNMCVDMYEDTYPQSCIEYSGMIADPDEISLLQTSVPMHAPEWDSNDSGWTIVTRKRKTSSWC